MLQTIGEKLEYIKEIAEANIDRFRGGVEAGLDSFRLQALRDGVDWDEEDVYASLMTELESLIQAKLAGNADAGDRKPRRHSVAWYIERHHEPVAAGVDMTVLQASYYVMYTKHHRGLNDMGMDEICGMIALGGLLREDNNMPKCVCIDPPSTTDVSVCPCVGVATSLGNPIYAGHNTL